MTNPSQNRWCKNWPSHERLDPLSKKNSTVELPCFGHGWAKKENTKKNIVAYTWWLQPLSACIIQRLSLLLCSSVVARPVSERNMHRWRKCCWLRRTSTCILAAMRLIKVRPASYGSRPHFQPVRTTFLILFLLWKLNTTLIRISHCLTE
jgi:hypothetical protein